MTKNQKKRYDELRRAKTEWWKTAPICFNGKKTIEAFYLKKNNTVAKVGVYVEARYNCKSAVPASLPGEVWLTVTRFWPTYEGALLDGVMRAQKLVARREKELDKANVALKVAQKQLEDAATVVNPSKWPPDMEAKRKALHSQRQHAQELLAKHGLIAVGTGKDEKFMLLHPSTRAPGKWQVSYFDRHGPYGHEEGKTQDLAIDHALEMRSLKNVRPMTEQEFVDISSTPEFVDGVKRVTYVGLVNQINYEFGGSDLVHEHLTAAQQTKDIDAAIEMLGRSLAALRAG